MIKFSLRRSRIQSVQPSSCFPVFRARSKYFASLGLGDDEEASLKMPCGRQRQPRQVNLGLPKVN